MASQHNNERAPVMHESDAVDDEDLIGVGHDEVVGTAIVNHDALDVMISGTFSPEEINIQFMKKDAHGGFAPDGPDLATPWLASMPSEEGFSAWAQWWPELVTMLKLSLPCMLANTSTQVMVITNQIFVGHIGVDEFAAAALANTWFNLMWAFMTGASTAMDTLASQAYGGKDYRTLLVWTYSGLILMTLFCFPIFGALYVSEHVAAVVFRQGYGPVATLMKEFCRALIPGMWPLIWSIMLMKFLQTQNSMGMPAAIVSLTCVINIGLNFWLVGSLGYAGAPWATTVCRTVQVIMMLVACIYQQHRAIKRGGLTWSHWLPVSWAALKTACHPMILWEHGKLAFAGGCMNAFEGGAFDVTTAFSGAFGVTITAAHGALLSICIFCFNALPFAVSIAGTIRCGNLLGSGRPKQAKLAGMVSMALGTTFQGLTGIILGATSGRVVGIFTTDPQVLATVKTVVFLAMAFQFSDGLFGTAQGVLRSMGGQLGCLIYNALGFWGGGVLVGWLLAFKGGLELTGLWVGLLCGDVAAMLMSVAALGRCNWRAEAIKAFGELQEAAMSRGGSNGDARDHLASGEAEGMIANVDLSDFDKEMGFFIVSPVEAATVAAMTLEGDVHAMEEGAGDMQNDYIHGPVPPSVLASILRNLEDSISAPGMMMTSRGASLTAFALADSRRASAACAMLNSTQSRNASCTSLAGHHPGRFVEPCLNQREPWSADRGVSFLNETPCLIDHIEPASLDPESKAQTLEMKRCESKSNYRASLASVAEDGPWNNMGQDRVSAQQDRSSAISTTSTIGRLAGIMRRAGNLPMAASTLAGTLSRGGSVSSIGNHSRAGSTTSLAGVGNGGWKQSFSNFSGILGGMSSARGSQASIAMPGEPESRRGSTATWLNNWRGSMSSVLSHGGGDRPSRSSNTRAMQLAGAMSRGGSVSNAAVPTSLMPLPGITVTPAPASSAIQIPSAAAPASRMQPPATTSALRSAMSRGLVPQAAPSTETAPKAPETQPPEAPAVAPPPIMKKVPRKMSLRRVMMKTNITESVKAALPPALNKGRPSGLGGASCRPGNQAASSSLPPGLLPAGNTSSTPSALPPRLVQRNAMPAEPVIGNTSASFMMEGPIARAARQGATTSAVTNDSFAVHNPLASLPALASVADVDEDDSPVPPPLPPALMAATRAHQAPVEPAGAAPAPPAGGLQAMSAAQLAQMMAMLQEEMQKRQT